MKREKEERGRRREEGDRIESDSRKWRESEEERGEIGKEIQRKIEMREIISSPVTCFFVATYAKFLVLSVPIKL